MKHLFVALFIVMLMVVNSEIFSLAALTIVSAAGIYGILNSFAEKGERK